MKIVHGIDFSGNAKMWRPGIRRSNVWVSTAQVHEQTMEVVALRPIQDLACIIPEAVESVTGGV